MDVPLDVKPGGRARDMVQLEWWCHMPRLGTSEQEQVRSWMVRCGFGPSMFAATGESAHEPLSSFCPLIRPVHFQPIRFSRVVVYYIYYTSYSVVGIYRTFTQQNYPLPENPQRSGPSPTASFTNSMVLLALSVAFWFPTAAYSRSWSFCET